MYRKGAVSKFDLVRGGLLLASRDTPTTPSKGLQSSPEVVRLAGMPCIRFPISLRAVEDLVHRRRPAESHETYCFRLYRFFRVGGARFYRSGSYALQAEKVGYQTHPLRQIS